MAHKVLHSRMVGLLLFFGTQLFLYHACVANDITDQVFGNIKEGIIAAFGDFNSDELTDIFIIRNDFTTLEILYGSNTEPLQKGPYCEYKGHEITSVVPGDFDGDAFMDVLVTLKKKGDPDNNMYMVFINWGGLDGLICANVNTEPTLYTDGEPLAIDFNRDMIIDLFGLNNASQRTFWIFPKGRSPPLATAQSLPPDSAKIRNPHAHSYLDLNQDFTADLFVQTEKNFEIWYGKSSDEKEGFNFDHTISLPLVGNPELTIGQSVFLDVELEGVQNQVLPVCLQSDCSNSTIVVYDGSNFCDIHVNFKDPQGVLWGFIKPKEHDVYLKTITARGGDYNMDGYPDLLVTLQPLTGPKRTQTFLLENVPCKIMCNGKLKRTFEIKWNDLWPMGNNTVAGAFYDFYQDGVLDVIFIEKKNGKYRPIAFRNALDYDANFFKVIVVTGLINKRNSTQATPLGRKKRTYGTNLPGPAIIYLTTTQEGSIQRGSSVQLPQSAYFALQLPYTIFGLGRTPNFVDSLIVGLGNKSRTFNQIIPNSQIIVVPQPIDEPLRWKAQLFVTPSKLILKSVIALGGTCLVIIFIIIVLHIKEKREDKQEKLQEAHRFHFDAM